MTTYKEISITGQLAWAKVQSPVNKYQSTEQQYELLVEVTDQQIEAIYKLEGSRNRKVREVEGLTGKFLKFTRPVLSKAGKEMPPVKVTDADGNDTDALIGNGSKAKVTFTLIPTSKGTTIIRPNAVQILELVTFEKKEAVEAEELTSETTVSNKKDDLDSLIGDVF